ncbi:spermatogenesis- and oogenesis-specific basic helix-loop-helix-containing protein 1 [Manis javanica]|uniref:spermatogenesis- and oogenesis-specific basic helix-loop-helix-containing protein 1 n=1 Tax=Manis javanica TaxID=9974 RepID=UPI003C6D31B2
MASQGPEPASGGCSSLACSAQFCEDPGRVTAPVVAEGPRPSLPRNVLSERERRKRISVSCERLRALLPRFDGRREDMASVLEMSVQFLRLAGTLGPGQEQHAVLASTKDVWRTWQRDTVQLALASHPAGAPDAGVGAFGVTMQQDVPCCVSLGEVLSRVAEGLDRPPVLPEPASLVPRPPGPSHPKVPRPLPLWPSRYRLSPSFLVSEEAQGLLGQAGPQAEGATPATIPDGRSVSGGDVEDGTSLLLTANPDWWLGSLEGKQGSGSSRALARSSPLERVEPGSLVDLEPGSQELPDGALELWGSDVGCPSPALQDEVDGIFPDFFAY